MAGTRAEESKGLFRNARIIDPSVPLEHRAASEPIPPEIHYVRHEGEGLAQMQKFFGVTPDDLVYSQGQGWATRKLVHLDQIPAPTGFYVSCLPVKIAGASAGWCRAVAILPAE